VARFESFDVSVDWVSVTAGGNLIVSFTGAVIAAGVAPATWLINATAGLIGAPIDGGAGAVVYPISGGSPLGKILHVQAGTAYITTPEGGALLAGGVGIFAS
jgi:hypothetical protein